MPKGDGKDIIMKKFFSEFKKFITRGNVMDMAVGVIVGGAFTAIVNGLSNFILKPIINYIIALILGANTLSELFTFLKAVPAVDEAGAPILDEAGKQVMDLTQSIYIDWGSFINAIINFLIIAFVLFTIVKIFNRFKEEHDEFTAKMGEFNTMIQDKHLDRHERKELRAAGVDPRDKEAVAEYFINKKKLAEEKAAADAAAAAEKARLEREANPTTEDLLKQILAELKNK